MWLTHHYWLSFLQTARRYFGHAQWNPDGTNKMVSASFSNCDHANDHIPHLGIVVIELRYNQVYYDITGIKYASKWESLYRDVQLTHPRAASSIYNQPFTASN
jgi:hypothetical protein